MPFHGQSIDRMAKRWFGQLHKRLPCCPLVSSGASGELPFIAIVIVFHSIVGHISDALRDVGNEAGVSLQIFQLYRRLTSTANMRCKEDST